MQFFDTQLIKLGRSIAVLVLTIVLGAVYVSYYRRSLSPNSREERGQKILPENISAVTEGFSFLQSDQGQAKLEINAKINLGFKDNKNLLESVTVKVFGKDGVHHDTITSQHCEYDQQKEEIVFSGDVVITLSQINNKTSNHKVEPIPNDKITTIHVERIRYLKSGGTAESDGQVIFDRGNIHGKGRGLVYDSNRGSLLLNSDVEIFVEPANSQMSQIQIRCGSLDYNKSSNQMEMRSKVTLTEGDTFMEADEVKALLREEDSSIRRIDAEGKVRSISRDPQVLLQVDAAHVSYFFDSTGRWLNKVIARQDVIARSLDPQIKRDLLANEMEILFRPQSNVIRTLHATGNTVLVFADKKAVAQTVNPNTTPPTAYDCRFGGDCEPGARRLKSPELNAFFRKDGKKLSHVTTKGKSLLEEFPLQSKDDKKLLSALSFVLTYGKDSDQLEKFNAEQQVKVDIFPPSGPVRTSTSDHLEAFFDPKTRQISQLHQFGHFNYKEGAQQAMADDARYSLEDRRLLLEGLPQIRDAASKTSADVIEFHQLQNLLTARGHVRSLFVNQEKKEQTGFFEPGAPVYASAESLEVQTQTGIARYDQKAKLWQDDQVLRATTIYLYRQEKRLVAEKNVSTLLYLESEKSQAGKKDRKLTTVQADRMQYDDLDQKIHYEKSVRMNGSMGTVQSDQLEVFLTSDGNQKSMERMAANGKVKILQPGKTSISDSAEFFQKEKKVILAGGPPRIVDSERGSTSGARLTLFFDDGSIAVEGGPETRSITTQRVSK